MSERFWALFVLCVTIAVCLLMLLISRGVDSVEKTKQQRITACATVPAAERAMCLREVDWK